MLAHKYQSSFLRCLSSDALYSVGGLVVVVGGGDGIFIGFQAACLCISCIINIINNNNNNNIIIIKFYINNISFGIGTLFEIISNNPHLTKGHREEEKKGTNVGTCGGGLGMKT